MSELKHRVYEGIVDGERFLFSVNTVREYSLRKEIEKGEKLLEIGELILETPDRNEALTMTDWCEF